MAQQEMTQPLKGKKPTGQRPTQKKDQPGSGPGDPSRQERPDKSGVTPNTDGAKPPTTTAPVVEDPWLTEQKRLEANRRMNAIAALTGIMDQYGLGTLMGKITEWVQDGYDPDAIMALIRTTPEYDNRFPAMKALAAKGRALSEAEYIAYERNAAELESLYGMPSGVLTDKGRITALLTKEVSAAELEKRVQKNAAAVYELPEEFRRTFRDFYGIDAGGLTAYYLDPEVSAPLLEKQFVSAQIGMEGALRGVFTGADLSEALYQRGVDREQAARGFGQVAGMGEFSVGKGETATQKELIGAAFQTDQNSIDKVKRTAQTRKGKFEAGGGFTGSDTGVSGLGSASS